MIGRPEAATSETAGIDLTGTPRPAGRALRVLVVEDHDVTASVLEFILERHGYAVTVAGDGRAAMARLIEDPPAVVLLDNRLPFVNGIDVLRAIRRSPRWHDTPVIVVTATAADRDAVDAFEEGATDFVAKPFSPDELLARVAKHAPIAR